MSGAEAFPLQWPVGVPRTERYRISSAPFSVTLGDATKHGLNEAIPPAYTRFIGRQLMAHLYPQRAAA